MALNKTINPHVKLALRFMHVMNGGSLWKLFYSHCISINICCRHIQYILIIVIKKPEGCAMQSQ